MPKTYSPRHIGECEYCLLAQDIRQSYEWSRERVEKIKYSNNPDDIDYLNKEVRVQNALWQHVDRMNKRLDEMHSRKVW